MRIIPLLRPDEPGIEPDIAHLACHEHPWVARKGRMLIELVAHLKSRGPVPRAFAHVVLDELWLSPASRYDPVQVKVAVVWRDFGPVRDGYPEMYYRLNVRRSGRPGYEKRTAVLTVAEDYIWEAFGWSSGAAADDA